MLICLLTLLGGRENSALQFLRQKSTFYPVLMFVQAAVMACGWDVLARGIKSLAGGKPGIETMVVFANLTALGDALWLMRSVDAPVGLPYSAPAALTVAFALLGGTPTSILFRTVREKLSLCYYCSAGCERNKGVAFIDSGVAPDKVGAAREEILRQLRLLQAGEFTEEDLEDTRRYLASLFTGMGDSQGALGSYYLSQATLPRIITPEEGLRELTAVTRDRVIAAAGLWEPACEYLLMPNVEEAEEDE